MSSYTAPRSGVLAAADEVAAVAQKWAETAERERRITPETADAVRRAGFLRHFVPRRRGGAGGGFLEYLRAITRVAEGDASAAWVAGVAAAVGRMAAFLPEEGQRALWEGHPDGPDVFLTCALMPGGTAVDAPGGWRVSGTWRFLSGVHYADWALLCCPVPTPRADGPEVRFLLVPKSAYTVEDSWDATGMRATGSDSVVLSDVFVPSAHSFARADLLDGTPREAGDRCHAAPLREVSGLGFAGPVLGAAIAAHRWCVSAAARKRAMAPPAAARITGGEEASTDLLLAGADLRLAGARLLLEQAARDADEGRRSNRAAWVYAYAAETAAACVHDLFAHSGTSAQATSHSLQRHWRDAVAGASHAALRPEPAARAHAADLLASTAP
ncbi:acyl-CoA dehydrogenase family protein [Actinomadura chibensis]|uniref:Hydrolase n=1 Tax=Actinomadura chibensis TaxID=392828 RepID=A0A5D0NUR4_9ACTN|nr:acyl-CoA dehydrogenase family protein [Actinomadura chibensis]TYB47992.1 hydrolase [Actinomadura chibensis]